VSLVAELGGGRGWGLNLGDFLGSFFFCCVVEHERAKGNRRTKVAAKIMGSDTKFDAEEEFPRREESYKFSNNLVFSIEVCLSSA